MGPPVFWTPLVILLGAPALGLAGYLFGLWGGEALSGICILAFVLAALTTRPARVSVAPDPLDEPDEHEERTP